jgi:hypothetical protein
LIAQTFSATRGHDHQSVATCNARGDCFGLQWAQCVESPDALNIVNDRGVEFRRRAPDNIDPMRSLHGDKRVRSHVWSLVARAVRFLNMRGNVAHILFVENEIYFFFSMAPN